MKTYEDVIKSTDDLSLFDSKIIHSQPEVVTRIRTWIEALRSGKYKQGKGLLYTASGGYCCLGVADEVLELKERALSDDDNAIGLYETFRKVGLQQPAGEFLLREDHGGFLTNANDCWDWDFNDIATFVENQLNAVLAQPATT